MCLPSACALLLHADRSGLEPMSNYRQPPTTACRGLTVLDVEVHSANCAAAAAPHGGGAQRPSFLLRRLLWWRLGPAARLGPGHEHRCSCVNLLLISTSCQRLTFAEHHTSKYMQLLLLPLQIDSGTCLSVAAKLAGFTAADSRRALPLACRPVSKHSGSGQPLHASPGGLCARRRWHSRDSLKSHKQRVDCSPQPGVCRLQPHLSLVHMLFRSLQSAGRGHSAPASAHTAHPVWCNLCPLLFAAAACRATGTSWAGQPGHSPQSVLRSR